MLSSLLESIRPAFAPAKVADALAVLREKHAAAAQRQAAAQAAYAEALGTAAGGEADMIGAQQARRVLDEATTAASVLGDAIQAAEHQLAEAQAAVHAEAIDKAWAATIAASKAREVIATKYEAKIKELGDLFGKLNDATAAVHQAIPSGFPSHAAMGFGIEADLCVGLTRIEFTRNGLPGSPGFMGVIPPTLAKRYAGATVCIEQAREQSREAAARG